MAYQLSKGITVKTTRRKFVAGASALAFAGLLNNCAFRSSPNLTVSGYGSLVENNNAILDLPEGFSYKVISKIGDVMDDGVPVPDKADGMGCFALDGSKVALVRNHEAWLTRHGPGQSDKQDVLRPFAYDVNDDGNVIPGGTTTIIYDLATGKRVNEFYSLVGTSTNCAGGITPWGTWLTCEETMDRAGEGVKKDHGWVFEVPANATGLIEPVPLKDMGRFNHEAAAVDPATGIVYLTEDRSNGLFYRFIPNVYGELEKGGKLQALGFKGHNGGFDSRNWDGIAIAPGSWRDAEWIDLEDTHSPNDDLRVRGYNDGAVRFARGEGIIWGDGELYFCCSTGGAAKVGQVMRYVPSKSEGTDAEQNDPGKLQLFFESTDITTFGLGDNLVVAPNGHLIVCEDHYDTTVNHIRGISPEGAVYNLAKVNVDSETAGACFSPDGSTLFVNVQNPTTTLAITGPWDSVSI